MSLYYFSALSSQDLGYITARAISGSSTANPILAGQYFMGFSTSIDYQFYGDVLADLGSTFDSQMPGTTTTFRYDLESQKVIMSSSLNTTWFFQTSSMKILGFNQQYNTTNVITGNLAPGYIWVSTYNQRSNDTGVFEDKQIYEERVADSGRSYAIGRLNTMNFRYWGHELEPKENLFTEQRVDRFTWQQWIRENRKGPYPFVVFDSDDTSVIDYSVRDGTYLLLADRMKFDPKQRIPDFFDFWDLADIKTRVLSQPSQPDTFDELPSQTGSFFAQQGNLLMHVAADAGATINVVGSDIKCIQYFDSTVNHFTSSIMTNSNILYQPGSSLVMNGQPAFTFTGSLEAYNNEPVIDVPSANQSQISGYTFFSNIQLLANPPTVGNQIVDIWFFNNSSSIAYIIDSDNHTITSSYFDSVGNKFNSYSSGYSASATNKLMLATTINFSNGSGSFYINGVSQSISASSDTTSANYPNLALGFIFGFGFNPGQNYHSYHCSDVMVYGNCLSASQLNNLQAYFGNKYNISYSNIT